MKKNVKLTLAVVMVVAAAFGGVKTYGAYAGASESDQLFSENIEALSNSESGVRCTTGCKAIGWGWGKILECDCNYDHFSCCDTWGC